MPNQIKHGDFTHLAKHYHHRAGYSKIVLKNLIQYTDVDVESTIADIGAGTGKLTKDLLDVGIKSKIIAIEPNESMRKEGLEYIKNKRVQWVEGSGEQTGLADMSVNWIVIGSAFHWMDVRKALSEFYRVLKPNGYFTALWNPRDLKRRKLHEIIEAKIFEITPHIKRMSSGSGAFTDNLFDTLTSTNYFKDVIYTEAKHQEVMSKERYMGIWRSVNDIRVQAGPEKWEKILQAIEAIIQKYKQIAVPYRTKSWTVRKK